MWLLVEPGERNRIYPASCARGLQPQRSLSPWLAIPARVLEVEEYARLITDNPGIMPWWDDSHISRPKLDRGAVVHHRMKVPGNKVGKMCALATWRPSDGLAMLRPLPARFAGHSDDIHIAKLDTLHSCAGQFADFIGSIEALLL